MINYEVGRSCRLRLFALLIDRRQDHGLYRPPEVTPAVDGPVIVELDRRMSGIHHPFCRLGDRLHGGSRQPAISLGIGLEVGAVSLRYGGADQVDHAAVR